MPAPWLELARTGRQSRSALCRALSDWERDPTDPRARHAVLMGVAQQEPEAAASQLGSVDDTLESLLRGTCMARAGSTEDGIPLLDRAITEARAAGDAVALRWALHELGRALLVLGDVAEAAPLLEEAQLLTDPDEEPYLSATLSLAQGLAEQLRGRADVCARHSRVALDRFTQLGDVQGRTHALCNLAGAMLDLSRIDHARSMYNEALRDARSAGLIRLEAIALAGMGGCALRSGDATEGEALYDASERLLDPTKHRYQMAHHDVLVARDRLARGDAAGAIARVERALARLSSPTRGHLAAQTWTLLAEARQAMGDHAGACDALRMHVRAVETDRDARIARARGIAAERRRALRAQQDVAIERTLRAELEARNAALQTSLDEQARLRAELEHLSRTDALTGLFNRRQLDDVLHIEVARARRNRRPLSLLLLDVDHFKPINDTWGHHVGDAVLVEFARRLEHRRRASDVLARWGGEEFCLILQETSAHGALRLADDIRRRIAGDAFVVGDIELTITASFGIAELGEHTDSAVSLMQAADRALYQAKASGRDCVQVDAG